MTIEIDQRYKMYQFYTNKCNISPMIMHNALIYLVPHVLDCYPLLALAMFSGQYYKALYDRNIQL